jgi:hypothetical protein
MPPQKQKPRNTTTSRKQPRKQLAAKALRKKPIRAPKLKRR